MTDHQRADTVLPENPCITPNVERLGREGITFTNACCPTPHCCPARATFFSGEYPSRTGIWNNVLNGQALGTELKPGIELFSEHLADAGYNMAFSGKWHVCREKTPRDYGWNELFVSATHANMHHTPREAIERAALAPEPAERLPGQLLRPGYGTDTLYRTTESTPEHDDHAMDTAVDALPGLASSGEPWGLFVGMLHPHAPYNIPSRYVDLYDLDDIKLPDSYQDSLDDKPRYYKRLRNQMFDQLSEREVCDAIRHFWACCTYLDEQFGRLIDALEATGQADNTIVLYTSDHGDYCGDHGLFHKGVPAFRSAYNVPAVMRWPDGIKSPGRRENALVSLADFAPTFCEAAGLPVPKYGVGRSLMPFLRDEAPSQWREEMHAQVNGVESYFTQRSVWTHEHKYVHNPFDYDEMYDLTKDPDEMVNVAKDPAYAGIKRDLVRRMWKFAHEQDDPLATAGTYVTVSLAPYGPIEGLRTLRDQ